MNRILSRFNQLYSNLFTCTLLQEQKKCIHVFAQDLVKQRYILAPHTWDLLSFNTLSYENFASNNLHNKNYYQITCNFHDPMTMCYVSTVCVKQCIIFRDFIYRLLYYTILLQQLPILNSFKIEHVLPVFFYFLTFM